MNSLTSNSRTLLISSSISPRSCQLSDEPPMPSMLLLPLSILFILYYLSTKLKFWFIRVIVLWRRREAKRKEKRMEVEAEVEEEVIFWRFKIKKKPHIWTDRSKLKWWGGGVETWMHKPKNQVSYTWTSIPRSLHKLVWIK